MVDDVENVRQGGWFNGQPAVLLIIFNAMARAGKPILMLKPMDVSLEDIFMQLTTADKEE